jgi:signal transduction histidine kinase/ActR/RegA family two-component response regulator
MLETARRFERCMASMPDAMIGIGSNGRIVLLNARIGGLFGYDRDELLGAPIETLFPAGIGAIPVKLDLLGRRRDGSEFPAELSLSRVEIEDGPMVIASIRDISDRVAVAREKAELEAELSRARRAEVERERHGLELQLDRMRRLESVGQLAGGIAHDFNNLLAVILNYAGFAAESMDEGAPALDDVEEIRRAAERGAALTRQLLIFSRHDVVRPRVLDLNHLLSGVEKLLRRSLGEHVTLTTHLSPGLWPVKADPGQLEQVLVNLAVNARDAMPTGGDLVIRTENVHLDDAFCALHGVRASGRYVRLTVTDIGAGMGADVVARAFEPFFTTKGEGTGLGLATAYGIINDAGGVIEISSQLGVGTTVDAYLPASGGVIPQAVPASDECPSGRGEAVLVVEDEEAVGRLTQRILSGAGYVVTTVSTPSAALVRCADATDVGIDLLLTDVIMPGMLGPELVERALAVLPALKVLFMSGYTQQAMARSEVAFIEKPFAAQALLSAVRDALDAPRPQNS